MANKGPKPDSIRSGCQKLRADAKRLLARYKELGEGGVTEAEGAEMWDIRAQLQEIGSTWNAGQCRGIYGDVAFEVPPPPPSGPGDRFRPDEVKQTKKLDDLNLGREGKASRPEERQASENTRHN